MAPDGSGGVVYIKKTSGRDHVFVVPFLAGAWGAPLRVDLGQEFDSSWARIAAGDRGRLLVTWVQEFGAGTDRMFSATLDPGSRGFRPPVPVDLNVGEATSAFPSLAMNAGGQAYLTYFVVTDTSAANPPGYVGGEVRLARYNNLLWSGFGSPLDRNPATPIRLPTAAAAPRVGVDLRGNAVVAWQEPDDEFVDRIWARRAFSGGTVGIPLQVSPSSWEGGPVRGPADAFGLDVTGFGQAAVAFRQQPGQSGKLTAPRAFVNQIGDAFGQRGAAFEGPRTIDGAGVGALGAPDVAVDTNGTFVSAFASGAATLLVRGDQGTVKAAQRIDEGASSLAGEPLVDLAETGATVTAWREQRGGGLIGVQEDRADGVEEPGLLAIPRGATVSGLRMGGSGLGDAILAWMQGSGATAQLAAAIVDAPPDPFLVEAPEGWVRRPRLTVHWAAATNAIGSVTYSVSVDDEPVGKTTRRLVARLRTGELGEGPHRVQVFAIDDEGQQTGSRGASIRIDREPPEVTVRRRGHRLSVAISDGARRATSGVKGSSVQVSFGDGGKGKQARHVYERAGVYMLRVSARDRAGNSVSFTRKVRIR
jgi:hypothetical protein